MVDGEVLSDKTKKDQHTLEQCLLPVIWIIWVG